MAWVNYANTGPFTNNVTPPGINATFLNNIESFLDQFATSVDADNNITTDLSGNMVVTSIKARLWSKSGHSLVDFNFGSVNATSAGVSVTHGLKNVAGAATAPGTILVTANSGTANVTVVAGGVTTTTFTVFSSVNINVWWLALAAS